MGNTEQAIWSYVLANPKATATEISDALNVSIISVEHHLSRIGTPEHIWRNQEPMKDHRDISGREDILRAAIDVTVNSREDEYGPVVNNMRHIAEIFNAVTGHTLSARDVPIFMQCVKLARRYHNPTHRDSFLDGAAYVGIEWECAEFETSYMESEDDGCVTMDSGGNVDRVEFSTAPVGKSNSK